MRYQAALHPDGRSVGDDGSGSFLESGLCCRPSGASTTLLKPDWLRVKAPQRERIGEVADLLLDLKLNTVCQEASCPNIGECFAGGTATFLIMGPGCTRACPYCDIDFDNMDEDDNFGGIPEEEYIPSGSSVDRDDGPSWSYESMRGREIQGEGVDVD